MVLRAFAHLPESLTDQPCSLRNKRKSGWPRAAALRVRHSLAAVLGGTGHADATLRVRRALVSG